MQRTASSEQRDGEAVGGLVTSRKGVGLAAPNHGTLHRAELKQRLAALALLCSDCAVRGGSRDAEDARDAGDAGDHVRGMAQSGGTGNDLSIARCTTHSLVCLMPSLSKSPGTLPTAHLIWPRMLPTMTAASLSHVTAEPLLDNAPGSWLPR